MAKVRFRTSKQLYRRRHEAHRNSALVLQRLTTALSRAVTPEDVAELAVKNGMQVVGGQMAMLCIVTPDGTGLRLMSASGVPEALLPYIQQVPLHIPGPLTDAIRTCKPLWIQSLEEYRALYPRLVEMSHPQTATQAVACLPMMVHQRVIGGITISFSQPHHFSQHDRALMIALVNQCAQAWERAYLYQAEHTARTVAEALSTTATILNSSLHLSKVLDHILENIRRVVPHDAADVLLLEQDSVRVVRSQGYDQYGMAEMMSELVVPVNQSLILQKMIETRQPMLIGEILDYPPEPLGNYLSPFHAYVGVPICSQNEIIGFLNLHSTQRGFFTLQHANWLKIFGEQAATAIQNARLYEQAKAFAAMEERQRLARDLHDAVSQMLFTSSMIAESLPRMSKINPEKFEQYLEQLHRLNRGAHAEMRNLILELNQENLQKMTLHDLLKQLVQAGLGRSSIRFDLEVDDGVHLPQDVLLVFYRITQESLNNIYKHSKATQVQINLKSKTEYIELSICDNGVGFDLSKVNLSSLGLRFMTERAETIRAKVEVEAKAEKGTTVVLRWSPVDLQSRV